MEIRTIVSNWYYLFTQIASSEATEVKYFALLNIEISCIYCFGSVDTSLNMDIFS